MWLWKLKQAGILSKEFGSAQGDRTRDEMNISFSVQHADLWGSNYGHFRWSLEGRKRAHWEHLHLLDVPTSHSANLQVFGSPQLNRVPKWNRLWGGLVTYLEDNSDFCKIQISHRGEATKLTGSFRSSVNVAKSQSNSMGWWAEVLGRKHKWNDEVWSSVHVVVAAGNDSFYGASVQKWE